MDNNRFKTRVALAGSQRASTGQIIGQPEPNDRFGVTLLLRRKKNLDQEVSCKGLFISLEELEEAHGASDTDLDLVRDFAEHFSLDIVEEDKGKRLVVLSGTALAFELAFKTKLAHVLEHHHIYRSRSGMLMVPSELEGVVGVFGLDNRPVAQPHFKRAERAGFAGDKPAAFDGNQLASIYNFPQATGAGQTISLIELGGGFKTSDLSTFFGALNLPIPQVSAVSVAGGTNNPGQDTDADIEVGLDIEVAGAVSPDSTIVVYFAPNTSQGFLQAILAAVHDPANQNGGIISISWGGAEPTWTAQLLSAMDEAFQSAAALGISVFVAAGDDGANDNVNMFFGKANVDFPASSPSVTACGGTTLTMDGTTRLETVWNDGNGSATGGGISDVFAVPNYQQETPMPVSLNSGKAGRGLPDVSAVADPKTGYSTYVDGSWNVIGGTSAVAPLFAGLMARINQVLGKPSGLINPLLYQAGANSGFNDVTQGDNSCDGVQGYSAGPGWDAVSGWGSPNGIALMNLLANRNDGSPGQAQPAQ